MPSAMSSLDPQVRQFLEQRAEEFAQIPAARRSELEELASYIQRCQAEDRTARLVFICTHNSRRSHLAQIWARVAAASYGVQQVETYSGGTEATALNPRAVAALQRAGLHITASPEPADNPRYMVVYSMDLQPLLCYSKVFSEAPNPTSGFCAVMTCSEADAACPLVPGSELRVAISYIDPKLADGSPEESAVYDERCRQICREMMYLLSQAAPASHLSTN